VVTDEETVEGEEEVEDEEEEDVVKEVVEEEDELVVGETVVVVSVVIEGSLSQTVLYGQSHRLAPSFHINPGLHSKEVAPSGEQTQNVVHDPGSP